MITVTFTEEPTRGSESPNGRIIERESTRTKDLEVRDALRLLVLELLPDFDEIDIDSNQIILGIDNRRRMRTVTFAGHRHLLEPLVLVAFQYLHILSYLKDEEATTTLSELYRTGDMEGLLFNPPYDSMVPVIGMDGRGADHWRSFLKDYPVELAAALALNPVMMPGSFQRATVEPFDLDAFLAELMNDYDANISNALDSPRRSRRY